MTPNFTANSQKDNLIMKSQIVKMEKCMEDVRIWMTANKLKLNNSKTEVLVVASKNNMKQMKDISICIGGHRVKPKLVVRNLGAMIDSELSMNAHINKITQTSYFHLNRIARIRPHLNQTACARVINATVTSRLDFHNALLLGLPANRTHKLQIMQNNAARLLSGCDRREHITPILYKLHWLPVVERSKFKVCCFIHKSIHSVSSPDYLKKLFPLYISTRSLRSSDDNWRLNVARVQNQFGERSVYHLGSKIWNDLPLSVRSNSCKITFKNKLKTFMFTKYFSA